MIVTSITVVRHVAILVEELQAGIAVYRDKQVCQLVATRENAVELLVAKTNKCIVGNGTAVIDMTDIGPHTGA